MLFSFSTPFYDKLTTIDQVFFWFLIVCLKEKKKKKYLFLVRHKYLEYEYFISLDFSSPRIIFSISFLPPFLLFFRQRKGWSMWTVYHRWNGDKLVRRRKEGRMERKVVGQRGRFASYVATLPGDGTLVLESRSGIYYWSLPSLVTLFSKLCRKEI